jgi:hypothetical protein
LSIGGVNASIGAVGGSDTPAARRKTLSGKLKVGYKIIDSLVINDEKEGFIVLAR